MRSPCETTRRAFRCSTSIESKQLLRRGVLILVSALRALKCIDRHGTTCATLVLLFLICAIAHTIAVAQISVLNGVPLETWPPRLIRNMAGIQFFEAHWLFTLPYLLLFLGTLVYMEIRFTPRWVVWVAFAFLSLPIFGYLWTCLHFAVSSSSIMGPVLRP
jgi:hypothetical protein